MRTQFHLWKCLQQQCQQEQLKSFSFSTRVNLLAYEPLTSNGFLELGHKFLSTPNSCGRCLVIMVTGMATSSFCISSFFSSVLYIVDAERRIPLGDQPQAENDRVSYDLLQFCRHCISFFLLAGLSLPISFLGDIVGYKLCLRQPHKKKTLKSANELRDISTASEQRTQSLMQRTECSNTEANFRSILSS